MRHALELFPLQSPIKASASSALDSPVRKWAYAIPLYRDIVSSDGFKVGVGHDPMMTI